MKDKAKGKSKDKRQDIVEIFVNDRNYEKPIEIHRGRQEVSLIKERGEIPQADVLEILVDGNLKPIQEDSITIKGGEEFFSHPKDGGSA